MQICNNGFNTYFRYLVWVSTIDVGGSAPSSHLWVSILVVLFNKLKKCTLQKPTNGYSVPNHRHLLRIPISMKRNGSHIRSYNYSWKCIKQQNMELISKFFQKHLLVTNIALSVTLSGFGDVLQQKYENRNRPITLKSTISQSNIMPNKAM